jgi:ATP synthase I chain.
MIVLTIAGGLSAYQVGGWRFAAGFLIGAAFSALNFRFFLRIVGGVGEPTGKSRPRGASAVFLGARYLLFGLIGYAILKFLEVSIPAALAGSFVCVAAVILEILYELIYAGT